MREGLARKIGRRERFSAQVKCFGKKSGWKGREEETILLINIKDATGEVVADHLWFPMSTAFDWLNPGDIIEFDARVSDYEKGYSENDNENPFRTDFRLTRPTKVVKTHYYDPDSKLLKETTD